MPQRFHCPCGHTWLSEFSDSLGDTTGVMPICPRCGESGEPAPDDLPPSRQTARDPTSHILSDALVISAETDVPPDPLGPPRLPGYEIIGELGRGGMGIVYRAHDQTRNVQVAVKCLLRHDPNKLLRFKQEFRAVVDLAHRNLASVFELRQSDGRWCLVMELVDGVPFTDYFSRFSEPDERLRQLRACLVQLVDALGYLHDSGLLHCDVKPTNVLITPQGRVVLLDFGLVTEWRPDPGEAGRQELIGSLGYIAPERFAGKHATAAVDWYSVGVMLFETFAGRRPFEGTRTNLIWQQRYMDPPMPSDITNDVPPGFDQLCVGLLERNPETRLGRVALLDFLRDSQQSERVRGPLTRSRETPLVGRDRQLMAFHEALASVRQGRTVLAVVRGRTGMGKSTLLDRFVERLIRRNEAVVMRGRCFEQESVPYKGVDGLIDALSFYLGELEGDDFQTLLPVGMGSLARMFPVLRRLRLGAAHWKSPEPNDPIELRHEAIHALRELLVRLGRRTPLILYLDDAQWADDDSARLLAALVRGPDPPCAMWIIGCRSEDEALSALPAEFIAAAGPEVLRVEIEVGPLSLLESASLAETLLADQPLADDSLAMRIAREARGRPVFIHHLVEHVRERLAQSETFGDRSVRLDEVIADRFRLLPKQCQQLVEVLAVAAQPLRQSTAFLAAGIDGEPRSALTQLRVGHWARTAEREDEHVAECFHDSVREAVTRLLTSNDLTSCHDRLARALALRQPHEHAWLAAHHLGAGRPDDAARHYARAAEDAEEMLAFDRAAQFLRLALDLSAWPPDEEARLRRRLADALASAGHGSEAAEVYLHAARSANPVQAARLRREAAYQYCSSGHLDAGLNCLRNALMDAGLPLAPPARRLPLALLIQRLKFWWRGMRFQRRSAGSIPASELERLDLLWSATAGLSLINVGAGAYYQGLHLRQALTLGEPHRLARAFAWQAVHASTAGRRSETTAECLLDLAHRLATHLDNVTTHSLLTLAKGLVSYNLGQWRDARASLTAADELLRTRCLGVAWERTVAQTFLLWCLFQMGELNELRDAARRMYQYARDRGDRLAATNAAVFALPIVCLAADDPAGAREVLHGALADWPNEGVYLPHAIAALGEIRIDLYENHLDRARQRLVETTRNANFQPFLRLGALRVAFHQIDGLLSATAFPARSHRVAGLMDKEATPAATAFAAAIRQMLGETTAGSVEHKFEQADMPAHAAAWRLHHDSPSAADWFKINQIVNREAFARMLLPCSAKTLSNSHVVPTRLEGAS